MMFHPTWIDDGADGDSGSVMATSNQYPLQPPNLHDLIFTPPRVAEESRLRSWKRKNNGVVVQMREHKKTFTDRRSVSITFLPPQSGHWVLRSTIRKRTVTTRTKIRMRPRANSRRVRVSTYSESMVTPMCRD